MDFEKAEDGGVGKVPLTIKHSLKICHPVTVLR